MSEEMTRMVSPIFVRSRHVGYRYKDFDEKTKEWFEWSIWTDNGKVYESHEVLANKAKV